MLMEKIYLIGLPIFFIGLIAFFYLASIYYEYAVERVRSMFVNLWIVAVVIAVVYPLLFDGIGIFSLIATIVFIVLVLFDQKIRNILLRENNLV